MEGMMITLITLDRRWDEPMFWVPVLVAVAAGAMFFTFALRHLPSQAD
jgi:hypothetical protein